MTRLLHTAAPLLLMAIAACVTSPTGRRQLMLVSDDRMRALGAEAFTGIKEELEIERDPATNRYVTCVANAVTDTLAQREQRPWEVAVFREPSANAFAVPGGKMGVHTGLLPVARTQDQLATVLAHEVGHVIAQHGAERVSQQLAVQGGLTAVDAAMQDESGRRTVLGALGVGATLGVLLPYSRAQESEADTIGLELMARAGFDPRASVELWQNMARATGEQPPEFLSTHPSHGTRIEHLRADMDTALLRYRHAREAGRQPDCRAPPAVARGPVSLRDRSRRPAR